VFFEIIPFYPSGRRWRVGNPQCRPHKSQGILDAISLPLSAARVEPAWQRCVWHTSTRDAAGVAAPHFSPPLPDGALPYFASKMSGHFTCSAPGASPRPSASAPRGLGAPVQFAAASAASQRRAPAELKAGPQRSPRWWLGAAHSPLAGPAVPGPGARGSCPESDCRTSTWS